MFIEKLRKIRNKNNVINIDESEKNEIVDEAVVNYKGPSVDEFNINRMNSLFLGSKAELDRFSSDFDYAVKIVSSCEHDVSDYYEKEGIFEIGTDWGRDKEFKYLADSVFSMYEELGIKKVSYRKGYESELLFTYNQYTFCEDKRSLKNIDPKKYRGYLLSNNVNYAMTFARSCGGVQKSILTKEANFKHSLDAEGDTLIINGIELAKTIVGYMKLWTNKLNIKIRVVDSGVDGIFTMDEILKGNLVTYSDSVPDKFTTSSEEFKKAKELFRDSFIELKSKTSSTTGIIDMMKKFGAMPVKGEVGTYSFISELGVVVFLGLYDGDGDGKLELAIDKAYGDEVKPTVKVLKAIEKELIADIKKAGI